MRSAMTGTTRKTTCRNDNMSFGLWFYLQAQTDCFYCINWD